MQAMLLAKKWQNIQNFSNSEFVKECLLSVTEILCLKKLNILDKISLSCRTITRLVEEITVDIEGTLTEKNKGFRFSFFFHWLLTKNSDVSDSAQLAIFIRSIDKLDIQYH